MRNMDKETLDLLRNLGLNQYESKIYLALSQLGPMTASELSDNADIPRPRTYDVLDKLAKKGFVSVQPGRPSKYNALSLKQALNNLKKSKEKELIKSFEQMDKIKERLEEKLSKQSMNQNISAEDLIWVLKNRANIYSKLEELIMDASDTIVLSSTEKGLKRKIELYEDLLREAHERGVKIKVITPSVNEGIERIRDIAEIIEKESHHRMVIADDEVLLFLTPDEDEKTEISAWIKSPYFAENMKKILTG